jgi:hypothetical protein
MGEFFSDSGQGFIVEVGGRGFAEVVREYSERRGTEESCDLGGREKGESGLDETEPEGFQGEGR